MARPMLRVAVVGAGAIAKEAHLPAWQAQPGAVVQCLVDAAPACAERAAGAFGVPEWTTDYRAILDRDDIEAVDICLPARLHAAATVAFLQVGKHVLVEKPFVTSLEEAEHVLAAERASDGVLMVAENWPFASAPRRVQRLLQDTVVGDLFMLRAHHESALYLADDAALPPRLQASEAVGGYMMSSGIHTINLAAQLMGGFDGVFAYTTSRPPSPAPFIERDVAVAVRFAGGGIGVMNFTGRSLHLGKRRLAFALFGTRGVIEFDVLSGNVVTTVEGVRTKIEEQAPSMGYREEIAHFCTSIADGATPLTTAHQQLKTLATVLAVYRSMHERREVRPADVLAETTAGAGKGLPVVEGRTGR